MTSTQKSASSAAWLLLNDYGLELECADVLKHQLEVARQRDMILNVQSTS